MPSRWEQLKSAHEELRDETSAITRSAMKTLEQANERLQRSAETLTAADGLVLEARLRTQPDD